MKTSTVAVFRGTHTFDNGGQVAKLDLLAGKDGNGKTRYLNGSFAITKHTKGLDAVVNAMGKREELLVEVEVANLYGQANGEYVNYRGMLNEIKVKPKSKKATDSKAKKAAEA